MAGTPQMGQFTYEMVLQFAKFQDALNQQQKTVADGAEKIRKQLESVADTITDKFKEVAVAVGLGLSIDKLVELGKAAVEQADKINNLSKVTGASTQTLQAYTYAADLTGGSIDTVSESVTHLAKTMTAAQAGNQQMIANYKAIGISATELSQLVKNPDKALQVVAQHFAQYADSQDKAALASQIFGRDGANLLPFLDKLGANFENVKDQATAFGLVLSDADQKALTSFKESSDQITEQVKGLANQFMVGLAPALTQVNQKFGQVLSPDLAKQWGATFGGAISTAIDWLGNMRTGFGEIAGYIDIFWTKVKAGAEIDIAYLNYAWDSFVANTKNSFIDLYGYALKAANLLQNGPLTAPAANDAIDEKLAGFKSAGPSIDDLNKKIADLTKNMERDVAASQLAIDSADNWAKSLKTAGDETTNTGTKIAKLPGDVNAAAAAMRKFTEDMQSVSNLEDQLSSGMDGPYLAALKTYQKGLDLLQKTWTDAVVAGRGTDALWNRLVDDSEKLGNQLDRTNAQIKAQHDLLTQQTQDFQNLVAVQGVAPDQQEALSAGLKKYDELLKSHFDFYGNYISDTDALTAALNKQLPLYVQGAQKLHDFNQAIALNQEAAKQWQGIWKTAGDNIADTFSKVLVEGGSLMDGLKDIAKQTVEAIISYFVKLSVINPILNAIFGGQTGFSILPTGQNGLGAGVGLFSLFGGGGGAAGGAGAIGSSGASLFSADTWVNAGKTIFGGFQSAWDSAGNLWSKATGAYTYDGGVMNLPGDTVNPTVLGPQVPGYGGYGSALGQGIGIAGGAFAGYNEFKNAGGGLNGLAGGLAYGAGTYFAGAGISAALSGGLSAGLAAIPVVGWVAIGAMVLDKLTGGGLFGTAWKPTGNTGLNISSSGSGFAEDATAEEKRKKALFQGSQTKTVSIDVPTDVVNSLNTFFSTLDKGLKEYAAQFGKTGAQVLDSVFKQTFDKNGKVTSTTETIGGRTFNDQTVQDYTQRLQAVSFEKVITDMGISVKGFVDDTADAATMLQQVQDVAGAVQEANTNLSAGFKFMALSANQSLVDVVNFTEGLAQSGETLTAAYERLYAAQAQYNQFVAQFAPATQYVDPYEQSISQLNQQMKAAMAQADALAKAAGAAGAQQSDLTNILKHYQAQMAEATQQLQASAQSLAFSLGLTTQGTLDQVNQAISDLEGSATDASGSVSSFGDTISKVSQKASDAMNLLLGDLSPLNDQQKLQTALQGLAQGTVTADQVLEIGRRLYASSEAYTNLFNQVMATNKGHGGQVAYGGGSSTSTGGGFDISKLSPADQQKLKELYAQRDTLQAAQTLGQFQQLAQQVAELATAKGEDFTQVLAEMGVKQADLEKGLGLKDDATLRAYVEGFQKQIDSAGDNTASIVAAIDALPAQLAAIFNSTAVQNALLNRFSGGASNGTTGPGRTVPAVPDSGAIANTSNVPAAGGGASVSLQSSSSGADSLETRIAIGVSRGVAPIAARIDASNRSNTRWRKYA